MEICQSIRGAFLALEYPSGGVMLAATLACIGFIVVGGLWFKKAEAKAIAAEKEAQMKAPPPG